jgi:hypothetical protein
MVYISDIKSPPERWPPKALRVWTKDEKREFKSNRYQCHQNWAMGYECMHKFECYNQTIALFKFPEIYYPFPTRDGRGTGVKIFCNVIEDQLIMEVKGKVVLEPKVSSYSLNDHFTNTLERILHEAQATYQQ